MALGTAVTHNVPVTIIPCGLKYFNSHQFRSKVVVEFGRPYQASEQMVKMYRESEKR